VGILGIMVLCYFIGKWRRKHKPVTLQEQIFTEEKRQQFSKVPKVKFTHRPINIEPEIEMESNYNEVLQALSNLGYNSSEAKSGADFAENNVPNGNTQEKIIDSLRFFNEKLAV
jgi:Holliday junction resolvasome RuvABC DNA-binding subunit